MLTVLDETPEPAPKRRRRSRAVTLDQYLADKTMPRPQRLAIERGVTELGRRRLQTTYTPSKWPEVINRLLTMSARDWRDIASKGNMTFNTVKE